MSFTLRQLPERANSNARSNTVLLASMFPAYRNCGADAIGVADAEPTKKNRQALVPAGPIFVTPTPLLNLGRLAELVKKLENSTNVKLSVGWLVG